jgi:hypothetical protein
MRTTIEPQSIVALLPAMMRGVRMTRSCAATETAALSVGNDGNGYESGAARRVIGRAPELREDDSDAAAGPAYINDRGVGDRRYAWSRSSRLRRAWR